MNNSGKSLSIKDYIMMGLSLIERSLFSKLALLQALFMASTLFQLAGIASIAPFIAIITTPSLIQTNELLKWSYDYFQFESNNQYFVAFAIFAATTILISNTITALSIWFSIRFSVRVGANLQTRLYSNYVLSPYVFFAQQNSSKLISNITQEIPRFIYMVVQQALNFVAQTLTAVFIIGSLFYVNITLAVAAIGLIGTIYVTIYLFTKKQITIHGQAIENLNQQKLKLLNESLHGIKEIKLIHAESWYSKTLGKLALKTLNSASFIELAGELPRYIVETVIFCAILGLAIFMLTSSMTDANPIAVLSFYAMAGYKLLPAIQGIYKSTSTLKAHSVVIPSIYRKLNETNNSRKQGSAELKADLPPLDPFSDIVFKNVKYIYPGSKTHAINDLSLQIKPMAVNAFVGASGAGKSTAADLLLGLLEPSSGSIEIGGQALEDKHMYIWQRKIGYVPQSIFLTDESIRQNIAFGIPREEIDDKKITDAIRLAQLNKVIDALPDGIDTKVGERGTKFSGGQIQRIGIARALYNNPDIIIFDEATSALDSVTELEIMNSIKEISSSKTIVIVAHRLSSIIAADNIILFDGGVVEKQGTYEYLFKHSSKFQTIVNASQGNSKPNKSHIEDIGVK